MRLLKNQKNTTSKASMSLVSKGAIGVDISQMQSRWYNSRGVV